MITSPESGASGVDLSWASCSSACAACRCLACLCIAQSAMAAQCCWKIARISPKLRRSLEPARAGARSRRAVAVFRAVGPAYDEVVSDIPIGSPPVPPGRHAAPGGWYPDPVDPAQERYWDGWQWSRNTRPRAGTQQPGFAPPRSSSRTATLIRRPVSDRVSRRPGGRRRPGIDDGRRRSAGRLVVAGTGRTHRRPVHPRRGQRADLPDLSLDGGPVHPLVP